MTFKKFDFEKFSTDVLQYRINDLNMGRPEFVKLSGITVNTLFNIETKQHVPRAETFWNICQVLGSDPAIYFK